MDDLQGIHAPEAPVRELAEVEAKVCFKLYRSGCFGKGHRLVDNVVKGFPSHEVESVRMPVEQLVADAILVAHPTRHGKAVFINLAVKQGLYDRIRVSTRNYGGCHGDGPSKDGLAWFQS